MRKLALLSKRFFINSKVLSPKKQHLELLTAILSIPVLVTVIILNLYSLNNIKDPKAKMTPAPQPEKIFINVPVTSGDQGSSHNTTTVVTTNAPCKKQLGPANIDTPAENETVIDNPTAITISYDDSIYCAAVWSYRINGGKWSDYDNKSIALYNLPQGKIKAEVKIKSIVTGDEKTLTRNFVYNGSLYQPQASSSAN